MLLILRVSTLITVLSIFMVPFLSLVFAPGVVFSSDQPENSISPSNHLQLSKKATFISSNNIGLSPAINGIVNPIHKGQPERNLPELAAPISVDEEFDTNIPSKTLFTFDDQSTLTISEDTIISINNRVVNQDMSILAMNDDIVIGGNDLIHNPDQNLKVKVITISYGWARFRGTKEVNNESTFKVITPSAFAEAKGTEFLTIVDRQGKTTFLVVDGHITAFAILTEGNKGKLSLISTGESQDFFPDGSQSTVRRLLKNF